MNAQNDKTQDQEQNQETHSRFFAPSSLARRIACTGSAQMEDGKPDDAGEYARWGSAAHWICQHAAAGTAKTKITPYSLLHQTIKGARVDQEMVDACDRALALMREHVPQTAQIEYERALTMPDIPDMRGTADVVADELFGRLTIVDYKFGAGVPVRAERNTQLMAYALMAAGEFLNTYQEIRLIIIQPRISETADVWSCPPDELARWRDEELMPAIRAIQNGQVSYNPSPETCRWCKGANDCPAYAQAALALAKADFSDTAAPVVRTITVTPELVVQVYPQLELLEDFIERVRAMALDMATAGNLPGYKLVEGRGRREWIDEQEVIRIIRAAKEEPFEFKIISPAKAEKLGKEIRDAVKPYIKRLPGNPVIAPENDKRQAIATAEQDFAAVA